MRGTRGLDRLSSFVYTSGMATGHKSNTTGTQLHPAGQLTETQSVYAALKRAILSGEFRPGEPLQEVRLASQFGASRTPVREALVRLEADGLLTITPRRGAVVRELTVRDFLEVNELRLILEPAAVRRAALTISEQVVADLQATLDSIERDAPTETDFHALQALDRRSHAVIAEASGNARMAHLIQSLNDMMQIVRGQDMRRRHREMHDSLAEILDALRRRDADAAESSLRRHIAEFSGALPNLL